MTDNLDVKSTTGYLFMFGGGARTLSIEGRRWSIDGRAGGGNSKEGRTEGGRSMEGRAEGGRSMEGRADGGRSIDGRGPGPGGERCATFRFIFGYPFPTPGADKGPDF